MHRVGLMDEMEKLLKVVCSARVTTITPEAVIAVDQEGNQLSFPADTVVYALGMKARREDAEALQAAAGVPVHEIGDCVRAAKVYEAIREGFTVAKKL